MKLCSAVVSALHCHVTGPGLIPWPGKVESAFHLLSGSRKWVPSPLGNKTVGGPASGRPPDQVAYATKHWSPCSWKQISGHCRPRSFMDCWTKKFSLVLTNIRKNVILNVWSTFACVFKFCIKMIKILLWLFRSHSLNCVTSIITVINIMKQYREKNWAVYDSPP